MHPHGAYAWMSGQNPDGGKFEIDFDGCTRKEKWIPSRLSARTMHPHGAGARINERGGIKEVYPPEAYYRCYHRSFPSLAKKLEQNQISSAHLHARCAPCGARVNGRGGDKEAYPPEAYYRCCRSFPSLILDPKLITAVTAFPSLIRTRLRRST